MKIVMVASESRPYCKTGGLADVVYSLSKELANVNEDVSIIIPYYSSINVEAELVYNLPLKMAWRTPRALVYKVVSEGITYYLVKNDQYFARGHLYGDFDDGERFAFLTLAAKAIMEQFKKAPDIVHVHDWQAGMLPCLIKEDKNNKFFSKTKFVGTIHNPAFQGLFSKIILGDLYNLPDTLYDNGQVRFKDQVSTLKTMIVYSDLITTVSPTHHLELLTPEGSMGLNDVLRLREFDFVGILNGIDYKEFNPSDDKNIEMNFNSSNIIKGKKANKLALLKQFNLKDETAPIFSLVTRITWQKGFDLVFPAVEELVNKGCNIIMLGSGEYDYEQRWEDIRRKYPDHIGIYIGYNDALAHKIYAGSDFFLMPSLFEPCGLGQMIAQRYGTLPIVRRTGGLKDSVINYDGNNSETSNGFGFDEYSNYEMNRTCWYAYSVYKKKALLHKLSKNAFNTDNSWVKSMNEYRKVYLSLLKRK